MYYAPSRHSYMGYMGATAAERQAAAKKKQAEAALARLHAQEEALAKRLAAAKNQAAKDRLVKQLQAAGTKEVALQKKLSAAAAAPITPAAKPYVDPYANAKSNVSVTPQVAACRAAGGTWDDANNWCFGQDPNYVAPAPTVPVPTRAQQRAADQSKRKADAEQKRLERQATQQQKKDLRVAQADCRRAKGFWDAVSGTCGQSPGAAGNIFSDPGFTDPGLMNPVIPAQQVPQQPYIDPFASLFQQYSQQPIAPPLLPQQPYIDPYASLYGPQQPYGAPYAPYGAYGGAPPPSPFAFGGAGMPPPGMPPSMGIPGMDMGAGMMPGMPGMSPGMPPPPAPPAAPEEASSEIITEEEETQSEEEPVKEEEDKGWFGGLFGMGSLGHRGRRGGGRWRGPSWGPTIFSPTIILGEEEPEYYLPIMAVPGLFGLGDDAGVAAATEGAQAAQILANTIMQTRNVLRKPPRPRVPPAPMPMNLGPAPQRGISPWLILGGGVLAVGTLAYFMMRKKKR